jgi:hypothetical protein
MSQPTPKKIAVIHESFSPLSKIDVDLVKQTTALTQNSPKAISRIKAPISPRNPRLPNILGNSHSVLDVTNQTWTHHLTQFFISPK